MPTILTVGHSNRTNDEFISVLQRQQVRTLVDIRRFPGSKRYPHFNKGELAKNLSEQQIKYVHIEALGGMREPAKDSKNISWRNKSFRGYADYMAGAEFKRGIEQLLELSRNDAVAIMCSEAVPWRCHRMLVSDYLSLLEKVTVHHIIIDGNNSKLQQHSVTSFARVVGENLLYRVREGRQESNASRQIMT